VLVDYFNGQASAATSDDGKPPAVVTTAFINRRYEAISGDPFYLIQLCNATQINPANDTSLSAWYAHVSASRGELDHGHLTRGELYDAAMDADMATAKSAADVFLFSHTSTAEPHARRDELLSLPGLLAVKEILGDSWAALTLGFYFKNADVAISPEYLDAMARARELHASYIAAAGRKGGAATSQRFERSFVNRSASARVRCGCFFSSSLAPSLRIRGFRLCFLRFFVVFSYPQARRPPTRVCLGLRPRRARSQTPSNPISSR
jgi:hypothetical protein